MIRRLRWKVVGLNMGMVFCVLLAVFAAVFFFARSALSRSVRQQMEEAVRTGVYDLSQPDGSTLPCFVAEVYASGTVRVSGNGYYDLTDKPALAAIVTAALSAQEDEGVLADYHLRYLRSVGLLSTRIAFTDSTLEQATLRGLLTGSLLIGFVALAVLFACSYVLSGAVTRPVARAWQQQKQFLSDASHELKTPLAGIRLLTDSILQTDNMDPETTKEFVTDIGREAERLSRITENLLRLTRLDDGVVPSAYPVAVGPVLQRVERMLGMVAAEKGVVISGAVSEDAVALATDDDVHQILYNLMENAIKYSAPENGFVRVEASVQDGQVVITVTDNGIGIPDEDLPHIFDRFYRVDKMRSREVGGTGLGLSIVKDTIEGRGGAISAGHGPDGVGTTFTVRLPLAQREEEA